MQSVMQDWVLELPFQQQSVLACALRGPDGVAKHHASKTVIRAYRASVIKAATTGAVLTPNDAGDTFMDARPMYRNGFKVGANENPTWAMSVLSYFNHVDEIPHHYHLHFLHAAQIVGTHHSDEFRRRIWHTFYLRGVDDMHLRPESMSVMDDRLNDFGSSPRGVNGHKES